MEQNAPIYPRVSDDFTRFIATHSDYSRGYTAREAGNKFDVTKPDAWRSGWIACDEDEAAS